MIGKVLFEILKAHGSMLSEGLTVIIDEFDSLLLDLGEEARENA